MITILLPVASEPDIGDTPEKRRTAGRKRG